MASAIIVNGHTVVKTGSSVIGETDENNDIRIKAVVGRKKIRTNLSGPELWERIINLGLRVVITVPFIKVDLAVLTTLVKGNATLEGQCGTLGATVNPFSLTITPDAGLAYTFPNTWVMDSYEISKFGYEAQINMVTFESAPDPTVNSAGTAPCYTTA